MPNAAACYILPPSETNFFAVNELLEWEATSLSPCLAYTFGNTAKNEKIRNNLLHALKKLNKKLDKKNNLVGVRDTILSFITFFFICDIFLGFNHYC